MIILEWFIKIMLIGGVLLFSVPILLVFSVLAVIDDIRS